MYLRFSLIAIVLSLFASLVFSANPGLKVNYVFNRVAGTTNMIFDETGNGYNAVMESGAAIKTVGGYNFFQTGSQNGFLNLGSKVGEVISTLNDFTISTYVYIEPSTNLSQNGNFIWTFSNSDNILNNPTGCMFFSAKDTRYAISLTNWSSEKVLSRSSESSKGKWVHYTYTQNGKVATLYINGASKVTNTNLDLFPSKLGATSYNYLARSAYSGDAYLRNSMYYDFRIYDGALSADSIEALSSKRDELDTLTFTDLVETELDRLQLENTDYVTRDINFPQSVAESIKITWQSSNTSVISHSGIVQRPVFGTDTAFVTLTAVVSSNFIEKSKEFYLKVVPFGSDSVSVGTDLENLQLRGNLDNLRSDLVLPLAGSEGSVISWLSDNTDYLDNNGNIVNRLPKGEGKLKVTLTASIKKGNVVKFKTFEIYLLEDEGFSGYLFTYFTGNSGSEEAIRFALSNDGLNYKALNNNNPVIKSADISETGGTRDPHILRGEDGHFYMVATDMVSAKGWDSNRGIVLLKSSDLLHWTSSSINITKAYSSLYSKVDRVWAPETIYDPVADKYMIYFSMRKGGTDTDKIYYAYANSIFTGFESAPKLLFNQNGQSAIDANIIEKDGIYNLFYKTEGSGNGIKKATSGNLTGPYTPIDKYLQPNTNAVEGECVFRLINSNTYYMIYDVYTRGYYEFAQSTDLDNFTLVKGISFNFSPRHGTIIPLTEEEISRLKTNPIIYSGPTTSINNLKNNASDEGGTQKVVSVNGFYFKSKKKTEIDIYTISGTKVKSLKLNAGLEFISVPSGVYIIKPAN